MEATNFADRLKLFMAQEGISTTAFADKCGIPRPSFSQIINGRNKKINDNVVSQIHSAFPSLSVMWLLFGEGEMIDAPFGSNDDNCLGDSSSESGGDGLSPTSGLSGFDAGGFSDKSGGIDDIGDFSDAASSGFIEDAKTLHNERFSSRQNPCDNSKNTYRYSKGNEYGKENGLKSLENALKDAENKLVECQKENAALLAEIEKMGRNPRRVVQITVFYDDSTFETFRPGE